MTDTIKDLCARLERYPGVRRAKLANSRNVHGLFGPGAADKSHDCLAIFISRPEFTAAYTLPLTERPENLSKKEAVRMETALVHLAGLNQSN